MSHGRILLICPVRNEAAFISKMISSLQNQTYSNWVLHIRDNASTDGTDTIIRQAQKIDNRIRMTSNSTPVSVYVNWLNAINEALLIPSDFVSGIAGDDFYENSTHLESLVAVLRNSAKCALPQFRLYSDTVDIPMTTKTNPKTMRRNQLRLATQEVYVCSIYGLFMRSEFERIISTRSGRLPTTWEPDYDYWFALEALRNAQSVLGEVYVKFVKGIGHTTTYYNPVGHVENLASQNSNTKILSMLRRKLFETFVEPPKLFLSGYKRISLRDLLWIPLFLIAMSAIRFGNLIALSIGFMFKPNGFRARFNYIFETRFTR